MEYVLTYVQHWAGIFCAFKSIQWYSEYCDSLLLTGLAFSVGLPSGIVYKEIQLTMQLYMNL